MSYEAVSEKKIHILRFCSLWGTMKTVARQVKWCLSVILACGSWRPGDQEFKVTGHTGSVRTAGLQGLCLTTKQQGNRRLLCPRTPCLTHCSVLIRQYNEGPEIWITVIC